MTKPNSPDTQTAQHDVTDQRRSQWLVPLVPPALGGAILIAAATNEHFLSGLMWFAALAAVGTALVVALTGCIVFALARGESTIPYAALLAIGGISYTVASVALRREIP
ncbi:MAG: hypothetical protein ABSG43_11535 [Solirubrobacteraceae bacterium]|jgi:hypothetical protein